MESDTPIALLVSREWDGTQWHYPNIERMVEENKRFRAELAAERATTAPLLRIIALIREAGGFKRDGLAALPSAVKAMRQQRDEARELNKEWQQKAATWLATPEAVARLQSYRDLGQQAAKAQNESDALRAELAAMREQRDAARREVCSMNETGLRMNESDKKREAKRRGWDCFEQQEGGGA